MKAVILAGGMGTRLMPLTKDCPKPMLTVGGIPVIGHISELLETHGITDVSVTLQYLPEMIINYLYSKDYKFIIESTPLGTAGSVLNALENDEYSTQPVLIISGDAMTNIDLTKMSAFHKESGAAVTMAVKQVSDPSRFGVVLADGNGRISSFQEKPRAGEELSNMVNCGIYIIEREVFELVPKKTFYDFGKNLFPDLLKRGYKLFAFSHDSYWTDIGDFTAYHDANIDALSRKHGFSLHFAD